MEKETFEKMFERVRDKVGEKENLVFLLMVDQETNQIWSRSNLRVNDLITNLEITKAQLLSPYLRVGDEKNTSSKNEQASS